MSNILIVQDNEIILPENGTIDSTEAFDLYIYSLIDNAGIAYSINDTHLNKIKSINKEEIINIDSTQFKIYNKIILHINKQITNKVSCYLFNNINENQITPICTTLINLEYKYNIDVKLFEYKDPENPVLINPNDEIIDNYQIKAIIQYYSNDQINYPLDNIKYTLIKNTTGSKLQFSVENDKRYIKYINDSTDSLIYEFKLDTDEYRNVYSNDFFTFGVNQNKKQITNAFKYRYNPKKIKCLILDNP
jgi:hypothetical protein